MEAKDLTKDVLIKSADDLSKIFEQPIETADDKTDIDLLKKDLIEAGNELQEGDSLTDESKDVLVVLGVKLPWADEEITPKTGKSKPEKPKPKKESKKAKAKPVDKKKPNNKTKPAKQVDKKIVGKKAETKSVKQVDKKPVGKETGKEKDEFGFSVNSKNSLFAAAIKEKPMTMAEIKKEKWNSKGGTHYSTWKALVEMGAGQKTKDGKMSIKKNWKK